MGEIVIRTHGLTRYFGRKAAVQQLNLAVPRGGVFALMGRNGSGKTTTIRMLLGIQSPTRGSASILGTDCTQLTPDVRSRIGYLSEGHFVYGWMRVRECARFQAGCFPHWNQKVFDAVIDHFNLDGDAKARTLSRGERAGLCLAITLAPEPELLVLDDPALGLDPVARRALVEAMLAVTSQRDRTILLSSHYLDDVERVADHIAILESGVLRVQCSLDEFRSRMSRWILKFSESPREIPNVPGLVHSRVIDNELNVTVANPSEETEALLAATGAITVERVSLALDHAVIDYLTDRGHSGSLLQAVGTKQELPLADLEPSPEQLETS
jgi:ABC-2 type transport system ATP-binding protein